VSVTPVLTRRYSALDVSLYQLGFAVAIILQPLATLRLELVLPVRSLERATRLFRIGSMVNLGLALAIAGLGVLLALAGLHNLRPILVTAGCATWALGHAALDNARLIRIGATRRMAVRSLMFGLLAGIFQIVSAYTFHTEMALGAALVIGRLVALPLSTFVPIPESPPNPDSSIDDRYTVGRAAASILSLSLSSLALQMPVLCISLTLGTIDGGQVSLAQRIAGVPGTLISMGLTQQAMAKASQILLSRHAPIAPYLRSLTSRYVKISLGLAPLIGLTGPAGVPLLFGPAWKPAGYLLSIFAIPFGLQLAILPMLAIYGLLGRERVALALQLGRTVALLLVVAGVSLATGSLVASALAASAIISVSYLSIIVGANRAAREHDKGLDLLDAVPEPHVIVDPATIALDNVLAPTAGSAGAGGHRRRLLPRPGP
jgi:O-antigen/teichoic acid export membrane protein